MDLIDETCFFLFLSYSSIMYTVFKGSKLLIFYCSKMLKITKSIIQSAAFSRQSAALSRQSAVPFTQFEKTLQIEMTRLTTEG
jgi:hypothetical protein